MLGNSLLVFAQPDALQGTLVETLKDVRPTMFFAVPRVWEKFEEKLKEIGDKSGSFLQSISGWAKSTTIQHYKSMQTHLREGEIKPDDPTIRFFFAKNLIINRIKSAMGLD